uniref:Uncharacterized protein n=1 Tax=Rhizophora mucronata TaxID=61149 RepID=A0A2P2NTE9_RHIMU
MIMRHMEEVMLFQAQPFIEETF